MNFVLKKEKRGHSSEVYAIIDEESNEIKGRLDLHFFPNDIIDGLIVFTGEISNDNELKLIEKIDSDLVPQAIINDKNFSITFVKASETKIYGKE